MNKKCLLSMDLQLFADGEDNPEITSTKQTAIEFNLEDLTDEQLTAIREKHGFKTDEDVNDIIKSKHAKWRKETEERESEAARLAKLSENERNEALFNKDKEAFEQEKAEFRKEQLFVEKGKQLAVEGMPSDFAHRIIGESAEEILEDVKSFRKEWDEALEKAVNLRLVQKQTKVGASAGTITKNEIMNIKDTSERQRAIAQNKHLF